MTELIANIIRAEWVLGALIGMYFSVLKIRRSQRRLTVFQRLTLPVQLDREVVNIVIRGNIRKGYYFLFVHLSFFLVGVSSILTGPPISVIFAGIFFPFAQGLLVADLIQTRSEELHITRYDPRTGAAYESAKAESAQATAK